MKIEFCGTWVRRLAGCTVVATALVSASALAQSGYPNRSITVVAPYSPGGDADLAARNFAAAAQREIGRAHV